MSLFLNKTRLDQLYPAHIQIDEQARILTLGPSLERHLTGEVIGKSLKSLFKAEFPQKISLKKENSDIRETILTGRGLAEGLSLRGGVLKSETGYLFLLGHACYESETAQLRELNFSDFAPTDSSIDLLFVSKFHKVLLKESRDMSQEVTKKKALAEAASVAKTQFLANMSHEIRTPMNGLMGMTQVLSNSDMPVEQREIVDIILESGEALMAILNDVLDISKIESGRMSLNPQIENINEIVLRAVELHRDTAERKSLDLTMDIDEKCPGKVYVDGLRLGQCLSNLVSNAIKFTQSGSVSVRATSERFNSFYRFKIEVTDTGIGIAKGAQDKVFEPFTQADGSTTRPFGGNGLGLSISKKFANMMGGDISIESELEKGSTFILVFEATAVETKKALSQVA